MRAVNLLPYQQTTDERLGVDRAVVIGVVVTVIIDVMLAGAFFLEKGHAATQRQRLAVVQAELEKAQSQQPATAVPTAKLQVPVVLSQQQPWHVALDAALATRVSWDVFLRQLEYVVPDKISLTSVNIGAAGATAGATTGSITLDGYAFSSNDVAIFLSTLTRVPNLSKVTLVKSTANSGSSIQTFEITAQMALPAALTAPPPTDTTTTTSGG